jgi:hypothetical protein
MKNIKCLLTNSVLIFVITISSTEYSIAKLLNGKKFYTFKTPHLLVSEHLNFFNGHYQDLFLNHKKLSNNIEYDTDTDTDGDGLTDIQEKSFGTSPLLIDTDGDGVSDKREFDDKTSGNNLCSFIPTSRTLPSSIDWNTRDCDVDGLTNSEETTGIDDLSSTANPMGFKTNPLKSDTDGDGVLDGDERSGGTDPLNPDTDGDGVSDGREKQNNTDGKNYCNFIIKDQELAPSLTWSSDDCDQDGLSNGDEIKNKTNPLSSDSDGDGVLDKVELDDKTNPTNACEFLLVNQKLTPSTDWNKSDCDLDGVSNGVEKTNLTNPLDADSDDDGVNDGLEISNKTNALKPDTDGDGVIDGVEVKNGTSGIDPCSFVLLSQTVTPSEAWLTNDCDKDGINNGVEITDGTDPLNPDSDGDGLNDGQEKTRKTNPLKADTDGDGVNDGEEVLNGTDPLKLDTDGDGLNDGEEKKRKTNPLKPDTDGDGLSDGFEVNIGTDPLNPDSDGDGVSDGKEIEDKTDPKDLCSFILANQTLKPNSNWLIADCDEDGFSNGQDKEDGTNPLVKDVIDSLNCKLNSYYIPANAEIDLDVLVAYIGGKVRSYPAGSEINLNNGTLTATLQAGKINPLGGNLIYKLNGKAANNSKIILPVNFGGKSCEVDILIAEPVISVFNFSVLAFHDKNNDCLKNQTENNESLANLDLYIKVYNLQDEFQYKKKIVDGTFTKKRSLH